MSDKIPLSEKNIVIRAGVNLPRPDDRRIFEEVYTNDSYKLEELYSLKIIPINPVILDIGAHVGSFALSADIVWPKSTILCAECCPENIPILKNNVEPWAEVFPAAVTYETVPLGLLNSVIAGGPTTAASEVLPIDTLRIHRHNPEHYWMDLRPLSVITLEEMLSASKNFSVPPSVVDILKLDCEGSEYSILRNTNILNSIKVIIGEYHDYPKFIPILKTRFAKWEFTRVHNESNNNGTFRLINPMYKR